MPASFGSAAVERLVEFLGQLGPRWGLPAEACRVHGYLYLLARPIPESEIAKRLAIENGALRDALEWLKAYGLVAHSGDRWTTSNDPWELILSALEERRRRELSPAIDVLRDCQRLSLESRESRTIGIQIGKLLAIAEDLSAIDMQARRFSPQTLRRLIGLGGRAARLIDRTTGRRGQK